LKPASSLLSSTKPDPFVLRGDNFENATLHGEFTPTTGLAVESVDAETTDSIHRVQISQTIRAIPLLLLFHGSAALSIHNLSGFTAGFGLTNIWHAAVFLTGVGFASIFVLWRMGRLHDKPEKVLRALELLCLLLGLVWATPAATAVYLNDATHIFPVAGICLAILGIAVASLVRVPTGATVFVALVTAALARSLYLTVAEYNVMSAIICAIYGMVLIGITVNSHMDFLRRSRAEIEVQRQNDVIKLLLNDFERDARDWLWETDADGRLTYFSPRFAEMLGENAEHLRLRPLRHLMVDHSEEDQWRKLDAAMADEAPISNMDIALRIADKDAFWQISARPLRDSRGRFNGYRGVCRDVTASLEGQRRIETAMETSERANAAKSQFLAVMSHELRTPINAIVGFSELLARDTAGTLPAKSRVEFANSVLEGARHLQSLINDILDATRIERGTLQLNEQENDAAELVEVAIKLCRDQAEKANISIIGRLLDGVDLRGDATRLKQVIINLLTNAIKFSPSGGIINIDMSRSPEGQFFLTIKDAGIGISKADMERIFEPFVQAESGMARRFAGVGLGLPIARRIARLHDGDVTLESTTGAGTTANFILPRQRVRWTQTKQQPAQNVA
jgi:PAS domain S-box-containing protein